MKTFYLSVITCLSISFLGYGQINVNTNLNDTNLIQTLGGQGVTINNVTVNGAAGSYGQFTNGNFGITQGVLLTSGQITNAVGPNNVDNSSTNNNTGGSALLDNLGQGTTQDACVVTFDIIPDGCAISFDYVFASEEYHEYVNSNFNDVFGFFISGPGIQGNQNIAVIPGGTTPVAINTVNNGFSNNCTSNGTGATNPLLFVDNCNGNNIQYDGRTTSLQAQASGLTPGQTYTITLAIADIGDGAYDSGVFIEQGSFSSMAEVAYHFENEDGVEQMEFCINEDVYLNGSATTDTGSYFMDLWIYDSGNYNWISGAGWTQGSPDLVNITELFENDPEHPVTFEVGVTYGVKLAINDPECGWVELIQHFTIVDCCDEFTDASFLLGVDPDNDNYSLIAKNYESYDFINATHEWYVLSSPNQSGGPYTPVYSTVTTGEGPEIIYDNAQYGLYYTVVHKVVTPDCGELCFARVQYQGGFKALSVTIPSGQEVDCCIVFDYWPNGPGEPMEFTAEFGIGLDPVTGNIITSVLYDYSNNPSAVHEWHLYSSPNASGGPYTFVNSQTGLDYTHGPIEDGLYYFLLHKVITDCGEVCYIESICRNCPEALKGSCDICGPVDCSILDEIDPPCEIGSPQNLQVIGTTLTWDPVPGAVEYIISSPAGNEPQVACKCTSTVSLAPQTVLTNNYEVPTSLHDDCFVWQVQAICKDGTISSPSQACFSPVKLFENEIFKKALVSPNPNNGSMQFTLKASKDTTVKIEVHDFYGKLVHSFEEQLTEDVQKSINWNASGKLSQGIYIVTFKSETETIKTKVIIE